MMLQTPSIGRVVHYHSYGTPNGEYQPRPRAAMITDVAVDGAGVVNERVSLAVFNPTGLFFDVAVPYSDEPKPGHWTWPPRV